MEGAYLYKDCENEQKDNLKVQGAVNRHHEGGKMEVMIGDTLLKKRGTVTPLTCTTAVEYPGHFLHTQWLHSLPAGEGAGERRGKGAGEGVGMFCLEQARQAVL